MTLPATGAAIGTGRAEIESFVGRSFADPGRVVDDAVLVGSELLTNAVRVGAPVLGLRLDLHVDEIEVAVRDDMPGRPEPLPDPGPTDAAGRGLGVVARVALDWGVRELDAGKVVWVRLPVPDGATARFNCDHASA